MVMVYHFKVYDGFRDEFVVPALKSTAERIGRVRGDLIPDSAEDVPASQVDDDGRCRPHA